MKNKLNHHVLSREIGFFSAVVVVIANMIGTGIFTTSGFIIQELGNPYSMLLCWFVGGIFALCGALCYGELGAMFPKAGGEYVFLRESFGKCMGFLSGWVSLIVGFSAPIAASAVAFSSYFFTAWGSSPHEPIITLSLSGVSIMSFSRVTLLGSLMIIVLSLVHYHSLSIGTMVQNTLTLFKISLILVFIAGGLITGRGSYGNFSQSLSADSVFKENFAVSLIFISYAYSGWNAAAYLGGEIRNPGRNIPLALFAGTFLVMCFYMLLNTVYIYALSPENMGGVLEVGSKAAVSLFGDGISRYFSLAIALGILSALSAMIMTGPRVYYAMAKDGVFFDLFGKVNSTRRTPAYSIFLQASVSVLLLFTFSYDKLLLYIGFTLSLFTMMTVAGMMTVRKKASVLLQKNTYKTFGYPITPLFFIIGNLWIIFYAVRSRPVTALYGLLTIVLGIAVYFYFDKKTSVPGTENREESGLETVN